MKKAIRALVSNHIKKLVTSKRSQSIAAYVIILILVIIVGIGAWYFIPEKESEQLIGRCAGVSLEHVQECCDNWARENNIIKIQCVGEWEIKDNKCAWICS